jgi:hypothetical protein
LGGASERERGRGAVAKGDAAQTHLADKHRRTTGRTDPNRHTQTENRQDRGVEV